MYFYLHLKKKKRWNGVKDFAICFAEREFWPGATGLIELIK
jgi:hypothetical protein